MNEETMAVFAKAGLELVSLLEERDRLGLNELLMPSDQMRMKELFLSINLSKLQDVVDRCEVTLAFLGTQSHARLSESIGSLEKMVAVISRMQVALAALAYMVSTFNLDTVLVDRQVWLQRKIAACRAVL